MKGRAAAGFASGALLIRLVAGALGGGAEAATVLGDNFTRVISVAMTRMHRDMMVPPTGAPDQDFAVMMIPHHQGAIDMAVAELRFGHNPVLRRLAQEIVVAQGQEIMVLRHALAASPQPGKPAGPTPEHEGYLSCPLPGCFRR